MEHVSVKNELVWWCLNLELVTVSMPESYYKCGQQTNGHISSLCQSDELVLDPPIELCQFFSAWRVKEHIHSLLAFLQILRFFWRHYRLSNCLLLLLSQPYNVWLAENSVNQSMLYWKSGKLKPTQKTANVMFFQVEKDTCYRKKDFFSDSVDVVSMAMVSIGVRFPCMREW